MDWPTGRLAVPSREKVKVAPKAAFQGGNSRGYALGVTT
jgi:hypothetical protein